jgi:hypothetical protein
LLYIFGYFIWDEIPTIKTLIGALLVIISLIIFRREIYIKKNYLQTSDMTKTPIYWNNAKKYLSQKDKIMKKVNNQI